MSFDLYRDCTLCPEQCHVDRSSTFGVCGESDRLSIAKVLLHQGEEPCISYGTGSGTIFFSGCALRCPFCQNMEISQKSHEKHYYTPEEFVVIIRELEKKGAVNINFVTPDHFMPHITYAVKKLKSEGFTLPFIYNASGYETISHLEQIIDVIDIFLIDYKFARTEDAETCLSKPLYPEVARQAITYLIKNKGHLILNDEGHAVSGTLIRHLVMPGFIENSKEVLNDVFIEWGSNTVLSLMSQFTPEYLRPGFEFLSRTLEKDEYTQVCEHALTLGFSNLYVQEIESANDPYIPDFASKKSFDIW